MADAGVDQTVVVNSTAYLDASGSVDPDGNITTVSWTVETPDGGTTSPDCADCRRTEFDADTVGQYTVTLTVTDDDGATRSDTLYVTVTNESGPDVSLSGPSSTAPNTGATFTASVSKDDASLQTLTWLVDGSVAERMTLNGSSATVSFVRSFDSAASVRVVVYDTLGDRGSATHNVSISETNSFTPGYCFDQLCGNGADKKYVIDGETTVVDTNNDGKIQTYENGVLTEIDTDAEAVSETDGGGFTISGGVEAVSEEYKRIDEKEDDDEEELINAPVGNDGGSNDDGGSDNNDGSNDDDGSDNDGRSNDDGGSDNDGESNDDDSSSDSGGSNDDGGFLGGLFGGGDDSSDDGGSSDDSSGDDGGFLGGLLSGGNDGDDGDDSSDSGDGGLFGGIGF